MNLINTDLTVSNDDLEIEGYSEKDPLELEISQKLEGSTESTHPGSEEPGVSPEPSVSIVDPNKRKVNGVQIFFLICTNW